MKQLRLLLLMLVACVAQVSMAQNDRWTELAIFKDDVRQILFGADNLDEANTEIENILADNVNQKYKFLKPDETELLIRFWIDYNKKDFPNLEKKVNKGKAISFYDALDIALLQATGYKNLFNIDYAKALQYFQLAQGEEDFKNEIKQSIVGCQYMLNKDKAAAKEGIIIDPKSPTLYKIAQKYGMKDIYAEKMQPLIQEQQKVIRRAIRSKDWETLASYSGLGIAEVDSLLAEYKASKGVFPTPEQVGVYTSPKPEFPGGDDKLTIYVNKNLQYPVVAKENGVQGRVTVSFCVEADGSLSGIKVTRSPDPSLSEEALRLVKNMPKWIPAAKEGKTYRCETEIPVVFRLQ